MPYSVTPWVNNATPAMNATNLNKLSNELKSQATATSVANTLPTWVDGAAPAVSDPVPLNEMERVARAVGLTQGLNYVVTTWQAGWTPARNSTNLNKLEQAVSANRTALDGALQPLPTLITVGGTYSGTASSTIQIRTSSPVIIQDSVITNTGLNTLIDANQAGLQLTIQRSKLTGDRGFLLLAQNYKSCSVLNCDLTGGWGIRFQSAQANATLRVSKNKFLNQQYDKPTDGMGWGHSHSCMVANAGQNHTSLEIDWNQFINNAGQSWVEDIISIYVTGKAWVHDNGLHGAYPPAATGTNPPSDYSGGGIMLGDGGGSNSITEDNIAVGVLNYLFSILGGHDNIVRRNRGISDSKNDSGVLYTGQSSHGLGLQNWDINNTGTGNFFNNVMDSNAIGVTKDDGTNGDSWNANPGNGNVITNTTHITVDQAHKDAEWQGWLTKLANSGNVIGAP